MEGREMGKGKTGGGHLMGFNEGVAGRDRHCEDNVVFPGEK